MAQREDRKSNQKFLVVKHHSICEESKTPREGFEAIELTNPKTKKQVTKYIDKWGAVTGFITNIAQYDTGAAYETRFQGIKISLDDDVVLDLPYKTAAFDAFSKAAENIDFSKEVTFSAYYNRAKDRTGFSIRQDGEPVDWKYTKDNMGDCPLWEKDEEGEWDSRKQRAFLKARIADVVIPAVVAANESKPKARAATASASSDFQDSDFESTTSSDDNVPF